MGDVVPNDYSVIGSDTLYKYARNLPKLVVVEVVTVIVFSFVRANYNDSF